MDEHSEHTSLAVDVDARSSGLEYLQYLNRALLRLAKIQPVDQVMQAALDGVYDLATEAQYARLFLMDGSRLKLAAARWADARQSSPGIDSPPDAFAFQVIKESAYCVRKDRSMNGQSGGVIGLPCRLDGDTLGALLVTFSSLPTVKPEQTEALQILAHQIARAVATSRKFDHLSRQAYTDALTGLPNRRALDERLEEEVRRSSRYQHTFTLIMIDLNSFKAINDSLGHPAGDRALQRLAECMRHTLRDTDFVARYGGDEFVVILPETGPIAAQVIAQRLREEGDRCSLDLTDLPDRSASISFGMAVYPEHAISPGGLITAADQALYDNKQAYYLTRK